MSNSFGYLLGIPTFLVPATFLYRCGTGLPLFCHHMKACAGHEASIDYLERMGKVWTECMGNCTELTTLVAENDLLKKTQALGCPIAENAPQLFLIASVAFGALALYCLYSLRLKV